MHIEHTTKTEIMDMLGKAQNVAILPSTKTADALAAGIGLYHMLKNHGKNVDLIYSEAVPSMFKDLMNTEEIVTNTSERELIVSIDYSTTPAAKVHYSAEDEVLVLRLGPVQKNFDLENVHASILGFNYDLVITIGVPSLIELGKTYQDLKSEIHAAGILNIDVDKTNERFGALNVVETSAGNLSMLVYRKAQEWALVPSPLAAKALLTGLALDEPKEVDIS